MLQVSFVIFKLLSAIDERLVTSVLLFLQLIYLLIHRIVSQFSQEHLFLLVDKLVHILGSLLLGELYTAPRNMHGFMDVILLFQVEILLLWIMITR